MKIRGLPAHPGSTELKRTTLCLEEDDLAYIQARAQHERTSISDIVRRLLREDKTRYAWCTKGAPDVGEKKEKFDCLPP
jgi:negative regulator of replication initiation